MTDPVRVKYFPPADQASNAKLGGRKLASMELKSIRPVTGLPMKSSKRAKVSPKLTEVISEGYEYLLGLCPACAVWRTMSFDHLTMTPGKIDFEKITLAQLVERLRCHKCGYAMQDVSPWRHPDKTRTKPPRSQAKKR